MRYGIGITCVASAAMLLSGCTGSTGGEGIKPIAAPSTTEAEQPLTAGEAPPSSVPATSRPPEAPPLIVTPDKIDTILGSRSSVGSILGTTLEYEVLRERPVSYRVDGPPECTRLDRPQKDVLGQEWTTYNEKYYRETKERSAYIVDQVAILYPDAAEAAAAFKNSFPEAAKGKCENAEIEHENAKWKISEISELTPTAARWTQTQVDEGTPWRCFYDYRTKNNVLFGAFLCQYGDGRPGVTSIADTITSWIPA